jgi:uncharacterized membrane protein YccC
MMRTLRTVVVLAILVNVMAAAIFAGWLWSSGRLNIERVRKASAIFKPTLAQEKQQAEKEKERQQQEAAERAEGAWAVRATAGPFSPLEQLAQDQTARHVSQLQQERLTREHDDLSRQFKLVMDHLAQEREALDRDRKAFDDARQAEAKRRDEPDFQKALELYEQLKPQQVKGSFQALIQQNQERQVVEYLTAMQPRKAAAVLSEFKTPEEIAEATALIQKIRGRGVEILGLPKVLATAGASAGGPSDVIPKSPRGGTGPETAATPISLPAGVAP